MDKLSFKLTEFEGPLDLLLHLISKHKMDICDVDITSLVDQYNEHIDKMVLENLDVSSEFLEMAARLVYMKSVMLLPKHEEIEQLKQELQGQLIEYRIIKDIAAGIGKMYSGDDIFTRHPMELPIDYTYYRIHDPELILKSYLSAVGKKTNLPTEDRTHFEQIVNRPVVSVDSRILYILRKLFKKSKLYYSSLFKGSSDKSEKVATFLAILELIKTNRLILSADNEILSSVGKGD